MLTDPPHSYAKGDNTIHQSGKNACFLAVQTRNNQHGRSILSLDVNSLPHVSLLTFMCILRNFLYLYRISFLIHRVCQGLLRRTCDCLHLVVCYKDLISASYTKFVTSVCPVSNVSSGKAPPVPTCALQTRLRLC